MKIAIRDRYGGPELVEIRELERPVPTEDKVLVRVHAASVNRADLDGLRPRWQFLRVFYGIRRPRSKTLGLDIAGVVEAVGPAATRFKVGDRVFADMYQWGQAAFAEYVCARERAFQPMPAGLSFEDAASLPHSALLALQGLRLRNGRSVKPGDKVLIVGASGNVGPFAVQIAKSMGAEVSGVCRTEKIDFVRSLGADHVIDYTKTDYRQTGPDDWIVDVDAHHPTITSRRALQPDGVYLAMGGSTAWMVTSILVLPFKRLIIGRRRMGMLLNWRPFHRDDVATLNDLVAAGVVKPHIDRRYPLAEIADALRYVDEGRNIGKVVITVARQSPVDPHP
jgi:NADPH:quinone reductase-like Zn-dependent oxidoreductase